MQRPDLIIFEQGEKAKAAEVNQNFEELGDYIQGSVGEMNTTVTNAVSSLQTLVNSAAPTGVVQAYAGNTVPSGWLLCDGTAVSRTQYSTLFSVIGTTFGGGDGSTTFNLPNIINKFIEGSDTVGTEIEAGIPDHLHYEFVAGSGSSANAFVNRLTNSQQVGSFANTGGYTNYTLGVSSGAATVGRSSNASATNAIYGKSETVQPPSITMKYIIKT